MPTERPTFTVPQDIVNLACTEVSKMDKEYFRSLKVHMRTHQPHLFTYLKSVAVALDKPSRQYEIGALLTYDILKRSPLPVDFETTKIPKTILEPHHSSATRVFNDRIYPWKNNNWIMNEIHPAPKRKTGQQPTPISEFFRDLRQVSNPFYSIVANSIKERSRPNHKKDFIRGIYDVLKPYMALVNIQSLKVDENWQRTLKRIKGLADSGYMKRETEGKETVQEVIIYAEDRLSNPRESSD